MAGFLIKRYGTGFPQAGLDEVAGHQHVVFGGRAPCSLDSPPRTGPVALYHTVRNPTDYTNCPAAVQGQAASYGIWANGIKFTELSECLTCLYSGVGDPCILQAMSYTSGSPDSVIY